MFVFVFDFVVVVVEVEVVIYTCCTAGCCLLGRIFHVVALLKDLNIVNLSEVWQVQLRKTSSKFSKKHTKTSAAEKQRKTRHKDLKRQWLAEAAASTTFAGVVQGT